MKKEENLLHSDHPIFKVKKTFGQKAADTLTKWVGSWIFIILFLTFLGIWVITDGYFILRYLKGNLTDPYPFILLNLALSCIAAIQAPIILMSQNREAEKDRLRAKYDYAVNRKAEKEIEEVQNELKEIKKILTEKR